MVTKKYTSSTTSFSFAVGKKNIRFQNTGCKGSVFTTSSPEIQDAIESSSLFGTFLFLEGSYVSSDDTSKKAAVELESDVDILESGDYTKVKTIQQANSVLKKLCSIAGISYTTLKTVALLNDKAKELGISFPNL